MGCRIGGSGVGHTGPLTGGGLVWCHQVGLENALFVGTPTAVGLEHPSIPSHRAYSEGISHVAGHGDARSRVGELQASTIAPDPCVVDCLGTREVVDRIAEALVRAIVGDRYCLRGGLTISLGAIGATDLCGFAVGQHLHIEHAEVKVGCGVVPGEQQVGRGAGCHEELVEFIGRAAQLNPAIAISVHGGAHMVPHGRVPGGYDPSDTAVDPALDVFGTEVGSVEGAVGPLDGHAHHVHLVCEQPGDHLGHAVVVEGDQHQLGLGRHVVDYLGHLGSVVCAGVQCTGCVEGDCLDIYGQFVSWQVLPTIETHVNDRYLGARSHVAGGLPLGCPDSHQALGRHNQGPPGGAGIGCLNGRTAILGGFRGLRRASQRGSTQGHQHEEPGASQGECGGPHPGDRIGHLLCTGGGP